MIGTIYGLPTAEPYTFGFGIPYKFVENYGHFLIERTVICNRELLTDGFKLNRGVKVYLVHIKYLGVDPHTVLNSMVFVPGINRILEMSGLIRPQHEEYKTLAEVYHTAITTMVQQGYTWLDNDLAINALASYIKTGLTGTAVTPYHQDAKAISTQLMDLSMDLGNYLYDEILPMFGDEFSNSGVASPGKCNCPLFPNLNMIDPLTWVFAGQPCGFLLSDKLIPHMAPSYLPSSHFYGMHADLTVPICEGLELDDCTHVYPSCGAGKHPIELAHLDVMNEFVNFANDLPAYGVCLSCDVNIPEYPCQTTAISCNTTIDSIIPTTLKHAQTGIETRVRFLSELLADRMLADGLLLGVDNYIVSVLVSVYNEMLVDVEFNTDPVYSVFFDLTRCNLISGGLIGSSTRDNNINFQHV